MPTIWTNYSETYMMIYIQIFQLEDVDTALTHVKQFVVFSANISEVVWKTVYVYPLCQDIVTVSVVSFHHHEMCYLAPKCDSTKC